MIMIIMFMFMFIIIIMFMFIFIFTFISNGYSIYVTFSRSWHFQRSLRFLSQPPSRPFRLVSSQLQHQYRRTIFTSSNTQTSHRIPGINFHSVRSRNWFLRQPSHLFAGDRSEGNSKSLFVASLPKLDAQLVALLDRPNVEF